MSITYCWCKLTFSVDQQVYIHTHKHTYTHYTHTRAYTHNTQCHTHSLSVWHTRTHHVSDYHSLNFPWSLTPLGPLLCCVCARTCTLKPAVTKTGQLLSRGKIVVSRSRQVTKLDWATPSVRKRERAKLLIANSADGFWNKTLQDRAKMYRVSTSLSLSHG
jgi:hypothetical protein